MCTRNIVCTPPRRNILPTFRSRASEDLRCVASCGVSQRPVLHKCQNNGNGNGWSTPRHWRAAQLQWELHPNQVALNSDFQPGSASGRARRVRSRCRAVPCPPFSWLASQNPFSTPMSLAQFWCWLWRLARLWLYFFDVWNCIPRTLSLYTAITRD